MYLLDVQNIVAGYGKIQIVQGVSLIVETGEFVGVIGPNGAGKSTFAKALFGLVDLFDGRVVFKGLDVTRLKTEIRIKHGMGFVPQLDNVFQDLSVSENLEVGGVNANEKRTSFIEEVLDIFPELRPKLKEKAKYLSGGEKQMLAIARALMAKPNLLVLDGPSAGLSPLVVERVFDRLRIIKEKGVTLLVVEQNVKRLERYAERLVVLVQGKKVFEGSSNQIDADALISAYFGRGVNI